MVTKKIILAGAAQVLLMAGLAASAQRELLGTVCYKGGEPAADAAVELEDSATLSVTSRRTDRDGHFHFIGLNEDKDYIVRATKKGYWSKPHTVSRFSSKARDEVVLTLLPR